MRRQDVTVRLRHHPVGHFDIYLGTAWEQAVVDQTGFLTRVLSP